VEGLQLVDVDGRAATHLTCLREGVSGGLGQTVTVKSPTQLADTRCVEQLLGLSPQQHPVPHLEYPNGPDRVDPARVDPARVEPHFPLRLCSRQQLADHPSRIHCQAMPACAVPPVPVCT
jgi:hypothetical protein